MNSNRRVLLFVLSSVGLLFLISVIAEITGFSWMPLKRINLISDVIQSKDSSETYIDTSDAGPVIVETIPEKDFTLYTRSRLITSFFSDTTHPSLSRFVQKLHELKKGKKTKIRIAYFGDSMIEGDLLTQTFREWLQKEFGGKGVGFVPITSQVSKFRQTVASNYSGDWEDENFKTAGNNNKLFFSGHLFRGDNAWVEMRDMTVKDSTTIIEQSLLYGSTQKPVNVIINGQPVAITGNAAFNRKVIASGTNRNIRVTVTDPQLPLYGLTFESESGVFVDNFSFRGITGIEFGKSDSAFLSSISENNPYDLVIFQYGVNLLFKPNEKNFSWYARTFLPVIKKFRRSFPEADFLLVSTADRAFRYGGEYRSAVGIDSLIKVQAVLAYETGCSFYNQFETMGGHNSIVEWAKQKPSLANQDYVHPNHRGAEILGNYFFEAIMNDYRKYVSKLK